MWEPYRPGMMLVGKRVRVRGVAGDYNEGTNAFDNNTCRLPAGLEGECEIENPSFAKVAFRRHDADNYRLWGEITEVSAQNISTGLLVCYISPARLSGFVVGS